MRRAAEIPIEYLAAGLLALVIGAGIFVLHGSSKPAAPAPAVASAPATSPSHPAAPAAPINNPSGERLLERAQQAYMHVPGISLSFVLGPLSLRYVLVLRADKVIAESFTETRWGQTTQSVSRSNPATYSRLPGSSCWKLLPSRVTAPKNDVGHVFPYFPKGARVLAPKTLDVGWSVDASIKGHLGAYVLAPGSYLVQALRAQSADIRVTLQAQNLTSTPQLPVPEPRCAGT